MPYPESPFDENFNTQIITSLKYSNEDVPVNLTNTLKWLCSAPKLTSYRVNTLKTDREIVAKRIQEQLNKVLGSGVVKAEFSSVSSEVIVLRHLEVDVSSIIRHTNEIVVDVECAAAVLRGAHIYAPGVLSMVSNTQIGDKVSIYADLSKKCKKGLLKLYLDEKKVFIGNGVVKMNRQELFGENLSPTGIAIEVTDVTSGCPPIGDDFLPPGWALLQNLPSILCVSALNPRSNEVILDMCAAPGNKTTHIAARMENKGILMAIDKTPGKLKQLAKTCKDFGARVLTFQADSCKIVNEQIKISVVKDGPPFAPETFDRILLDAPCSVLGKRPQFCNRTSEKVIQSYVPLQRKLFSAAVALLKPKGILVYSTCTITLAENEGMVAWALRTFACLELVKPEKSFGDCGWPGTTLTDEERGKVQRFGPGQEFDSVGFFIATFVKK